jgi:hypothetical protein
VCWWATRLTSQIRRWILTPEHHLGKILMQLNHKCDGQLYLFPPAAASVLGPVKNTTTNTNACVSPYGLVEPPPGCVPASICRIRRDGGLMHSGSRRGGLWGPDGLPSSLGACGAPRRVVQAPQRPPLDSRCSPCLLSWNLQRRDGLRALQHLSCGVRAGQPLSSVCT